MMEGTFPLPVFIGGLFFFAIVWVVIHYKVKSKMTFPQMFDYLVEMYDGDRTRSMIAIVLILFSISIEPMFLWPKRFLLSPQAAAQSGVVTQGLPLPSDIAESLNGTYIYFVVAVFASLCVWFIALKGFRFYKLCREKGWRIICI